MMMFLDDDMLRRLDLAPAPRVGTLNQDRPLRIALYSHDAQGLGHMRRNLLISQSLIADERVQPSVLLISGLRETASYTMPDGVDSVTLPALGKAADGSYHSRSLKLETEELVRLRSSLIRSAIESYEPDVLLVDKLPLGIFGELKPALAWLCERTEAKVVLGMRDILDEPAVVRREWARDQCTEAIREYYHRIWVYGDRRVYDAAAEYSLPSDIAAMMRYTGYLNPRHAPTARGASGTGSGPALEEIMDLPTGSLTLCVIGGGRDGVELASAFLRAKLPPEGGGVLVTGPLMDGEDRALLHSLAADRSDMRLIEFVTDPQPLLCCADRVISMGGYNSVCEVLAFHKRTLIVPRVTPRREQIIRAERFAQAGLLDMLHPDALTPEALSAWMQSDASPMQPAERVLDFHGTQRLPELLLEALGRDTPPCQREKTSPEVIVQNGKAARHA
ncbi:Mlr3248 protein [hydrothermal vent metagenome]|uniref:Mlr3248 protein n=1 Tax=hydrothermal vent metagenome TaxID=652676 RepID=A0A3B1DZ48_9ZZZZ